MIVAVYRFPCEMLRALPLADGEPPAEILPDASFERLCDGSPDCPGKEDCQGSFVCKTDLADRGRRRVMRRKGGLRP